MHNSQKTLKISEIRSILPSFFTAAPFLPQKPQKCIFIIRYAVSQIITNVTKPVFITLQPTVITKLCTKITGLLQMKIFVVEIRNTIY